MTWISVEDKKPDSDSLVLVMNSKGWMYAKHALYYKSCDVFVLYDPQSVGKLTLDATHWMEIPERPKEKTK